MEGHVHHHGHYGYYRGVPILIFSAAVAAGSIIAASTFLLRDWNHH